MNYISKRLCMLMIERNIIVSEYRELYEYGIRALIMQMVGTGAVLLIGIMMNSIVYAIVFLLSIISLRAYFSGIHISGRFSCFLCSCLLFIFCLGISKYHLISIAPVIMHIIIIFFAIWMNMEQLKKTTNKIEISARDKLGILVTLTNIIIYFLFCFMNLEHYSYGIYMSIFFTFIFYIIKIKKEQENCK